MNTVIFNIPVNEAEAYRGQNVVLRAKDATDLARTAMSTGPEDLVYVQLLDLHERSEPLLDIAAGVGVDLVLDDPALYPRLYDFSSLGQKHPVRVTVSAKPGVSKAVKLALALNFAVKLDIGQPGPEVMEELAEVCELFLHRSTVEQSVEFFQSIFLSYFNDEDVSLWHVQEEDPDEFCFVSEEGVQVHSRRILSGIENASLGLNAVDSPEHKINECDGCEYFSRCRGYFKLPDPGYSCVGVKGLFSDLRKAAAELRSDLAAFADHSGGKIV